MIYKMSFNILLIILLEIYLIYYLSINFLIKKMLNSQFFTIPYNTVAMCKIKVLFDIISKIY